MRSIDQFPTSFDGSCITRICDSNTVDFVKQHSSIAAHPIILNQALLNCSRIKARHIFKSSYIREYFNMYQPPNAEMLLSISE